MAKKKSYTVKKKKAAVRERKEEYGNKTLRIYHSFEEANEADHKESASRTPLENLYIATQRIKRIFNKELREKMTLPSISTDGYPA
jgi:hypothetical protein